MFRHNRILRIAVVTLIVVLTVLAVNNLRPKNVAFISNSDLNNNLLFISTSDHLFSIATISILSKRDRELNENRGFLRKLQDVFIVFKIKNVVSNWGIYFFAYLCLTIINLKLILLLTPRHNSSKFKETYLELIVW